MTRIVCWQPLLTAHQRSTLDALGRTIGAPPTYFVAHIDDAIRARQGWSSVTSDLVSIPLRGWFGWAREQLRTSRDAVHIFGSPFENVRLIVILATALIRGDRVWLVSEPWSDSSHGYFSSSPTVRDRVKRWLRPLLYQIYGLFVRSRAEGVFAISRLAVRQYRTIGMPAARIFPFGYFVPFVEPTAEGPSSGKLRRIAFVGALIPRKGVADLIAALGLLASRGIDIDTDLYGPGDPAPIATSARVRYVGMIPFGETQRVVAAYDLLVVPSHHDGWAVVVNEALMAGVPVVVSDRTGAGAMVEKWGCGASFRAGDAAALAAVLEYLARHPAKLDALRTGARAFRPQLDPEVAGKYMAAAITGRRPECPWFDA